MEEPPVVGLVLRDDQSDTESLLQRFVARLTDAGTDVAGILQQPGGGREMVWTDITSGQVTVISQSLGKDSRGCRVDPAAVAVLSQKLRDDIGRRPALLVINRFGRLEAEGNGLAAEMLEAMAQTIPLLTSLAPTHRDAWDSRTGGIGTWLPADDQALWAWWQSVRPALDRRD
jgi:hypothetical protein